MNNKRALKVALYFMVAFSLFMLITPPLVSPAFGHESWLRSVVIFFGSVPFDIPKHVDQLMLYLSMTIVFWTSVVYVLTLIVDWALSKIHSRG